MTFVTVFRRVPRPITGMIGLLQDPDFERFEANLDWLETTGLLVEQFDPSTAQKEVAQAHGRSADLVRRRRPLLAVDPGERISGREGTYLSRTRLARAVGQGRGWKRSVA